MFKALIVDDEPLIKEGLKHIIDWEEHGIELVGEASNGEEALEAINKYAPSILLTDIKMPVMDGLQLIRSIREKHISVKVVVISGFDDFQFVKEALRYGVENYILKPVSKDELSSTLLSTIEKIQSEFNEKIKSRENEDVIRDNILYRLVTNHISLKEVHEKSYLLGFDIENNAYMVSIVKILDNDKNFPSRGINDSNLVGFAIINICSEIISEYFKCSIFQDLNGDIVIIIHDLALKNNQQVLEDLLSRCASNVNKYLMTNVFITIGNIEGSLDCVHKSYDIAMELMHYFLIYPPNSIMNCEKVEQGHKKRQKICDVDLDILGNLIVTCRKNEIISFFDDIQRKITGIDGVTLEYIHIFTIEVLSCYIIAIKSISLEISDILKDYESLFSNVLKQNTINGILASMKHISIEITDGIYQQKENPKTLVDQIMEYINANFQRIDLS